VHSSAHYTRGAATCQAAFFGAGRRSLAGRDGRRCNALAACSLRRLAGSRAHLPRSPRFFQPGNTISRIFSIGFSGGKVYIPPAARPRPKGMMSKAVQPVR